MRFLRSSGFVLSVACGYFCLGAGCSSGSATADLPDGSALPDGSVPRGDGSLAQDDSGSPVPRGQGDPCVPISVSVIAPRVGYIAALVVTHRSVPPAPANGSVNVSRDSADRVTYISYDSPNSAEDYTDNLSYDSAGRLTYFSRNGDGDRDVTENFSYSSSGMITYFNRNASGSVDDLTENFSYSSDDRLTYWSRNADGQAGDITENFSYDSAGRITYFSRNGDGSSADDTENFSYDSTGRLTYWSINGDGSADASVTVSYSSSGSTIQANGTRAAGAIIRTCSP